MLKKIFLSASLCVMLAGACPSALSAQESESQPAPYTEVQELPDGQEEVVAPGVPSEETNTIRVSETARKMTQAEKAQNVKENDSWGGAITIISMVIVIGALIVLSLLFMGFGKISEKLLSKKKLAAHGKTADEVDDDHEDVDSGEVIAAIAAALNEHFNTSGHDLEHTILTIRRLRRAYSPWNSKIYNIRQNPELSRNPQLGIPVNKNYK